VIEYDWREDVEFGRLQAYVCRACGYTELHTELHTEKGLPIPVEKIPGAKVLKAT
jgi:hypothetical protein